MSFITWTAGLVGGVFGGVLTWVLRVLLLVVGGAVGLYLSLQYEHKHKPPPPSYERLDLAEPVAQLANGPIRAEALRKKLPSWVQYPDFQRVHWVDRVVLELWPYIDAAVTKMVKDMVPDMIKQNIPAAAYKVIEGVNLTDVTLGAAPPLFGGIKTYDTSDEEVVLEVDIIWVAAARAAVGVTFVRNYGVFPIEVSDIAIRSTLRINLRPLIPVLPCFGKIMACLVKRPSIDFALKLGSIDLMAIPGVHHSVAFLAGFFAEYFAGWPKWAAEVPVVEGDYVAMRRAVLPKGKLLVHLVEAKSLRNVDTFGKSDPFVEMHVNKGRFVRSVKRDNTLSPVWGANYTFGVNNPGTDRLHLRHDKLGLGYVTISKLKPNVASDMWLDLKKNEDDDDAASQGKKPRGQLHLVVTWQPFSDDTLEDDARALAQELEEEDRHLNHDDDPISGTGPGAVGEAQGGVVQAVIPGPVGAIAGGLASKVPFVGEFLGGSKPPPQAMGANVGSLKIQLHKAVNLANGEKGNNPYVKMRMRAAMADSKKSKVVRHSANPVWEEPFEFPVGDPESDELLVEVFDKDLIGKKFLGRMTITVAEVQKQNGGTLVGPSSGYPLLETPNSGGGSICMDLSWIPGG
eukprot:jgi/Chlat1/376/Chrsp10S01488